MKTKDEELKGKGCPDDPGDIADNYVMGHLSLKDAEAFAIHCRECARCNEQLRLARRFADAVRNAAVPRRKPSKRKPRNKAD